jgi:glycosyltransferase involved in cell wall biosynthesis
VKILLSSYNGGLYLREQLDSLIAQDYENIEIYVRDDGSKDATPQLLKEYESKGLIHLALAENIGVSDSFFTLMRNCGDADYFAWCDQDDVWEPWKISEAVAALKQRDSSIPLMWYSIYDFYDSNMKLIRKGEQNDQTNHFTSSLLQTYVAGCTEVFNRKACDMMREKAPYSFAFDGWVCRLAAGLGEVIYCGKPTMKHRIHSLNTSEAGADTADRWKRRFATIFGSGRLAEKRRELEVFCDYYSAALNAADQKVMALFSATNMGFIRQIKKLFYYRRFRTRLIDEIATRLLFVLNKL